MMGKTVWPTYLLKFPPLNIITINISHEIWNERKHTMTDTNLNIVFRDLQYNFYPSDLHNLLDEKSTYSYDPEKNRQKV